MTLWDFAVLVYARKDVEVICLELQDVDGQCVPLLLFGLWSLGEGRQISPERLRVAAKVAHAWEKAAIGPLRSLRRELERPAAALSVPRAGVLGEQIKACELTAERLLLETLEAMAPEPDGASVGALDALEAVVHAWGAPAAPARLARLIKTSRRPQLNTE